MAPGFATLPLELIDSIAEYSDESALRSLSLADRRVNGVCTRWMYRDVVLDNRLRAVACFKTLVAKTQAAQSVRALILRFHPSDMLASFYRILRAALLLLTSVEYIEVIMSTEIFGALADIHFPRLRECAIPFCADIIPFLHLHPEITGLSMDPVPHSSVTFWTSMEPILLPDLHMFSGPGVVALSVIPRSRTSHMFVFWDPRLQGQFSDVFNAIESSGTVLLDVQNIFITWEPQLLTAITKFVPNLTSLSIRNVSSIHAPTEMQAFFSGIDETLKSLRSLTSLSIIQDALSTTVDPDDLDWEFQTMRKWGDIAPSLHCCVLPSETKWLRIRHNVWYPSNLTDNTAHLLERFRWFVTTVVSEPALPPDYFTVLEVIGGKEMVGALKAAFDEEGLMPEFELAEKPMGISITFAT
ncbi:hypothetical protein DFH09DRAFT_1376284 [Mycena vulgaris]|nr:hypothetical protein DFH09DRAFT_1376284 [Mycena vulgaris]